MKKATKTILIVLIITLMLMGTTVHAVTPTLAQIADKFNNCSTVKEYASYGSVWRATVNGNKLNISMTANGETTNIEYTLRGTILETNLSGDSVLAGAMATVVLTDCIGQLHGYAEGELLSTLGSEKINNYTIENEGFEIINMAENSGTIKIDISKKIPLADMSDVYLEVSDLEDLKRYIAGDGFAEKSKGNVWFNKNGTNGENTVLVAEKNNLTDNTYKSILSILEVMFDTDKAPEYFRANYSGLSVGNKEFTGFKVEVNPTKTEFEEDLIPSDSGYKFVRITINKNLAKPQIDKTYKLGDINKDGKVDTKDARLALLAYVGKEKLTTEQTALADVNKDTKVDTKDARQILLYYVGKIKNF